MNRPFLIALAVLLCGGLAGVVALRGPANPVYQGKPLSVWLKESEQANSPTSPATEALRHYGRDAEPLLTSMLEAQDSSLGMKFRQWLSKQSFIKFQFQPASVLNLRALHACSVLGPEVSGTAPAITAYLERPSSQGMNMWGRYAYEYPLGTLAGMGPEGIKGLIQELVHPNGSIRVRAAELLGTAPGSGTPEVLAALQKCTANANDPALQNAATRSLELIQKRQAQHIPAGATNWTEAPASASGNLSSVWDLGEGTRVLKTSGLEQGQGTWHAGDVFGARRSRVISGETGSIVFDNSQPDGFTHFIEWETPQPVTVRSFGFVGAHDTPDVGLQRALRTFRLFARTDPTEEFKLIYSEELTVPYGGGYRFGMLFLFRNLDAPINARQFRAEFVQNGAGAWHGPRAVQLYGFPDTLNWAMVEPALQNLRSDYREGARRYFGKEK